MSENEWLTLRNQEMRLNIEVIDYISLNLQERTNEIDALWRAERPSERLRTTNWKPEPN
jgi:hypothetical protein